MSQNEDHRAKLMRLADALMQDILASSDEDILAEIDITHIGRARALLVEAKAHIAKQALNTAKIQLDAWRVARRRTPHSLNRVIAQEQFDNIRRADYDFDQKMLLAARNGRAPTDNDKEGLVDDLADLRRLEDEDTLE